jgi:uncharacterized membrane protein (DUF106 family)
MHVWKYAICYFPICNLHLGCFSRYINVGFILMQSSLESVRQRADDSERKYNETQESSEDRRKKLEETEKKVHQLQESLAR